MTVVQKNRQAFAAAAFALQQKRLLLAQEHPEWDAAAIDLVVARLGVLGAWCAQWEQNRRDSE